ncbi:MAG: hypothetical protein KBG15_06225 [Kofleriaceae bacterium]|nr:hypothetical protein [Kofleriaceae bacterium]
MEVLVVTPAPTACAYCGDATSSAQAILDVDGWRCAQCQLRSAIAISHGADEQFGSIGRQAMVRKGIRVRNRAVVATLAMVGCLGVVGYLMTLPNDVSSVGLYAIVGAFTSTVVLGFELAAHRRIKNALQQMALPAANVVAE